MGYHEASVTTNQYHVTTLKSEDLIYTAAGAWNQASLNSFKSQTLPAARSCNTHIILKPNHLTYRSFATKVSQLKICDFSGETF